MGAYPRHQTRFRENGRHGQLPNVSSASPRRRLVIFRQTFRKSCYGMPACALLRYAQAGEHQGSWASRHGGTFLLHQIHTNRNSTIGTSMNQLIAHAMILDMARLRSGNPTINKHSKISKNLKNQITQKRTYRVTCSISTWRRFAIFT